MSNTEEQFIRKANECIPTVTQALLLLKKHLEEHLDHQLEVFEDRMVERVLDMSDEICG